jgi:hypothetical protein
MANPKPTITADQIDAIIKIIAELEPYIVDLIIKIRSGNGTVIDMNLMEAADQANLQQVIDWLEAHKE